MSADTVAAGQLRAFVERVERIEANIADLNSDKSEVYKELRGVGFDVKTVRKIVAKRKIADDVRDEQDALFDLYWSALNGAPSRVHVHEAETRVSHGKASDGIDPSTGRVSPTARNHYEGGGSANEGGSHEVSDGSAQVAEKAPNEEQTSLAAREGEQAAAPIFRREPKPLRPHCKNPDRCGGYGSTHCRGCLRETERAA